MRERPASNRSWMWHPRLPEGAKPVPGRELHPLEGSGFHGVLFVTYRDEGKRLTTVDTYATMKMYTTITAETPAITSDRRLIR